jgi:hypothetical protein
LNTVAESLEHEYPDSNKGRRTGMSTVKDWIVDRESRTSLYVLGAAGLLVLVACSNVASLMVTRSTARQQELGIPWRWERAVPDCCGSSPLKAWYWLSSAEDSEF